MVEIESKASNLASAPIAEAAVPRKEPASGAREGAISEEVDDGRALMQQIFVDGRIISLGDFEASWVTPSVKEAPGRVIEPFVHLLAEKAICPVEKSLKLISDKTRLGYVTLDRYDIDVEVARSYSKEICQRWCVLPFDRMSKTALVATTNPFNKRALEELQRAVSQRVVWYLVNPVDLMKGIKKIFR
jgi:hypothetical protein